MDLVELVVHTRINNSQMWSIRDKEEGAKYR